MLNLKEVKELTVNINTLHEKINAVIKEEQIKHDIASVNIEILKGILSNELYITRDIHSDLIKEVTRYFKNEGFKCKIIKDEYSENRFYVELK